MLRSIKISEENYRKLNSISGKLRESLRRPVSINEAITIISRQGRLSDLAGSWKSSDSEIEEFMSNLKKGWGKWSKGSA